jgi:hypothetical protein
VHFVRACVGRPAPYRRQRSLIGRRKALGSRCAWHLARALSDGPRIPVSPCCKTALSRTGYMAGDGSGSIRLVSSLSRRPLCNRVTSHQGATLVAWAQCRALPNAFPHGALGVLDAWLQHFIWTTSCPGVTADHERGRTILTRSGMALSAVYSRASPAEFGRCFLQPSNSLLLRLQFIHGDAVGQKPAAPVRFHISVPTAGRSYLSRLWNQALGRSS